MHDHILCRIFITSRRVDYVCISSTLPTFWTINTWMERNTMLFNEKTYPVIMQACEEKTEIEFEVLKEISSFANHEVPEDWTESVPTGRPDKEYQQIVAHARTDGTLRGALIDFVLMVYLRNGRILYKKSGNNRVLVKAIWTEDITS